MSEIAKMTEMLREPFAAADIEWRISRVGTKGSGGVWAKVLAYIDARAVMDRLDDVFGIDGWRDEYRPGPDGGVLCRLEVRFPPEGEQPERWLAKEDVAENTSGVEGGAVKGGVSGALKRAVVKLGVGRYLYNLPEGWATILPANADDGEYVSANQKKGTPAFKWLPPPLPTWALPGGLGHPPAGGREASAPPREQPQASQGSTSAKSSRRGAPPPRRGSTGKNPDPEWAGDLPKDSDYGGSDGLQSKVEELCKAGKHLEGWREIRRESEALREKWGARLRTITPAQIKVFYAKAKAAGADVDLMKRYVYRAACINRHAPHDGDHLGLVPMGVSSAVFAMIDGGGVVELQDAEGEGQEGEKH